MRTLESGRTLVRVTAANGPRRFADASVPRLRDIWIGSLVDFSELAFNLPDNAWDAPSMCSGWSNGNVVAHVLSLESELHGKPLPEHEPDWAALPHVTNPLSQYTETPVDWYRKQGRDVVLAELREILEWRRADLAEETSDDPDETVTSIGGWRLPRAQMIRTRILDIWTHTQDIREAIGEQGDLGTDAAWVTAEQFVKGLPFVWAKQMSSPIGSSVQLNVTGPGVEFSVTVLVNESGRGVLGGENVDDPTVALTVSWPLYAMLSAGRVGAVVRANQGGALLTGDAEIGALLIERLVVTP